MITTECVFELELIAICSLLQNRRFCLIFGIGGFVPFPKSAILLSHLKSALLSCPRFIYKFRVQRAPWNYWICQTTVSLHFYGTNVDYNLDEISSFSRMRVSGDIIQFWGSFVDRQIMLRFNLKRWLASACSLRFYIYICGKWITFQIWLSFIQSCEIVIRLKILVISTCRFNQKKKVAGFDRHWTRFIWSTSPGLKHFVKFSKLNVNKRISKNIGW